ncbi:heme A synthase [Deinococcus ruber]|uniref:Heme A synthase n=1 Tax=Deinococcus ruber TaxID=1848197 RepID=A0A918F012_9DEIO|nr:heme A synthase [Deinococcus ruber]
MQCEVVQFEWAEQDKGAGGVNSSAVPKVKADSAGQPGRVGRLLPALAWTALGYNVLVILWGAFVRISGSGAGCGEHWPLCNGVALPVSPTLHTIIEFSHRLTSGLSGLLAIGLVGLALFRSPKGHPVRTGALLSLLLIIFEGLVGGVQVLLGLTATSTNPARGFVQGVHLANTFALLGALLLTAVWASGGPRLRLKGQGVLGWLAGTGLVLMLILGMAGAVTALGDLLFTPTGMTPLDTVRQDFSLSASIIQNLRVVHPILALGVSAYLFWFAGLVGTRQSVSGSMLQPRRWKISLHAIIALQILAGVLNVILKAPGWMQMLHLFLACVMWLGVVMLCYSALVGRPAPQTTALPQGVHV